MEKHFQRNRGGEWEGQIGCGLGGMEHMYTLPFHKYQTDHHKTVVLGRAIAGPLLSPQIPYMLLF